MLCAIAQHPLPGLSSKECCAAELWAVLLTVGLNIVGVENLEKAGLCMSIQMHA